MLAINRKVTIPGCIKAKGMVKAKKHGGRRKPGQGSWGEGDQWRPLMQSRKLDREERP